MQIRRNICVCAAFDVAKRHFGVLQGDVAAVKCHVEAAVVGGYGSHVPHFALDVEPHVVGVPVAVLAAQQRNQTRYLKLKHTVLERCVLSLKRRIVALKFGVCGLNARVFRLKLGVVALQVAQLRLEPCSLAFEVS